jgi:hypothetical protein
LYDRGYQAAAFCKCDVHNFLLKLPGKIKQKTKNPLERFAPAGRRVLCVTKRYAHPIGRGLRPV